MDKPFYRLKGFVARARELGLDVSERTVRFYVSRGLIDKPIKNPYAGADGRVAFFPRESLKKLRRVQQLINEGYKLEQIGRLLEKKSTPSLRQATSAQKDDWRRQVAGRYLNDFASRQAREARTEFLLKVAGSNDDEVLVTAGKAYLARRLERLVGPEAARSYVEEYFLKAQPIELDRRLVTFKKWRDEAESTPGKDTSFVEIQRLTGNLLLKLVSPGEFEKSISQVKEAFDLATADAGDALEHSTSTLGRLQHRGVTMVKRALGGLIENCQPPVAAQLAESLDLLKRGHSVLEHVAQAAEATATALGQELLALDERT